MSDRYINPDGTFAIERRGHTPSPWTDLYHAFITMRWSTMIVTVAAAFVMSNVVFGVLYTTQEGCVSGAEPGSLSDAFFFSVQSMTTIGFGHMAPATMFADILVTIEVFFGVLGTAMVTGLIFAKFSLPTARVIFSRRIVIDDGPNHEVPTLMFRMGNARSNQIVDATVSVIIARNVRQADGTTYRTIEDLPLSRSRSPLFQLSWTVMHPLDEYSPLSGLTPEVLHADCVELVVSLSGVDGSLNQIIHARHAYGPEDILFATRMKDILGRDPDGTRYIDYSDFHEVEPLARAAE